MQTVFHLSDADPSLHDRLLSNVSNLLDDDTLALDSVAVVTNSGGLDLVRADSERAGRVRDLLDHGVAFKQCANTIEGTDTGPEDLVSGVELVSSGVGELTRLQADGYAYITP
jgi:intracellular sulfur oxidation DsrE/DsrF family protein